MLKNKPGLVEAMYFCELNTPTEYLGPMYGVLSRRRARILKEEMQEGSPFFTVHAYIPVSESFGFTGELRSKTSGAASALLVLSHWEALLEDPFFVPKTEERNQDKVSLLTFKASIFKDTTDTLSSWISRDCCDGGWEGVQCDASTGRVNMLQMQSPDVKDSGSFMKSILSPALGNIPDQIGNLKSLTSLQLSGNQLTRQFPIRMCMAYVLSYHPLTSTVILKIHISLGIQTSYFFLLTQSIPL